MAQNALDRRRCERIVGRFSTSLLVDTRGAKLKYPAYVIDLSELGLRLKSEIALSPGQTVEVVFTEPVPSRIVWAGKPRTQQEHEAGLEYLRKSSRASAVPQLSEGENAQRLLVRVPDRDS